MLTASTTTRAGPRSITRSSGWVCPVQLETILETAASARQHGDAKRGVGGLLRLGDDLGDPGGGSIGNGELFHAYNIGASVAELKRRVIR